MVRKRVYINIVDTQLRNGKEETMQYLNLKAEMAKKSVLIEDISKLLNIHRNSVANKLAGKSSFSIDEAFKIHDAFFKEENMEYLFKTE